MEDWLFVGDALCADFANTLRDRWSRTPRETLSAPADLTGWFAASGVAVGFGSCTDDDLAEARALRAAVYAVVRGDATSRDIATVDHAASLTPRPRLVRGPSGVDVQSPVPASADEALGLVAADLVTLAADGLLDLVKECAHERCGLVYVDRSRGSRRRWCSMQRCGNRAKVNRFEQRRRQSGRAL